METRQDHCSDRFSMAAGSTVRLADYQPYPFKVATVHLEVQVQKRLVQITSTMAVEPRRAGASEPMLLRGEGLDLVEISRWTALGCQSLSPG